MKLPLKFPLKLSGEHEPAGEEQPDTELDAGLGDVTPVAGDEHCTCSRGAGPGAGAGEAD
jgi:hypothetical protein